MSQFTYFVVYDYKEYDDVQLQLMKLLTSDTYNEAEISKSILKIDKNICCCIALQLALIGWGQKNYNKCSFKETEIDIKEFFNSHKITYNSSLNDKLHPNELTPRRLIRFFRYHIQKYLIENKTAQSYIFKKYCNNHHEKFRIAIFPGFEHIASPEKHEEEIHVLLHTYMTLDIKQNTKISDRIYRVLLARGFDRIYLDKIKINFNLKLA